MIMKRISAVVAAVAISVAASSCGKKAPEVTEVPKLSPETILSVETAASITGNTMRMSDEGVTQDGNEISVTYVTEPLGAADSVSITIEQFSDTLPASQVWADYEAYRVRRSDAEMLSGIGTDCYVAYPFISLYDRGCMIRITAGSGSDEGQKNLLITLASNAAAAVEQQIPAEAVSSDSDDVIK